MAHDGHDHHHHDDHHHHSVDDHRRAAPSAVAVTVIVVSDTRTVETDEAGRLANHLLEGAGHTVSQVAVVRDEVAAINQALDAALASGARAVVLTGGTGLSHRDVTVEAVSPRFGKRLPGFGELFRSLSFHHIGTAALATRAEAGVVDHSLVFVLPGAPGAVRLALEKLVLPELGHLVREVLR
jgi:molybdopterin adenylyltransferase